MRTSGKNGSRRTAAQMHALAAVRREIAGRDCAARSKYLREFTHAFQKYERVLAPGELHEKIAAATLVLVGDYHALASSQQFAAQLLEESAQGSPVVLGLEAVLSRDQRILDLWWRREISEQELRSRLRFDREWGYEWPALYGLMSAARDHAEGLYGLDCLPRHDLRKIRSRDRHAAIKIAELRARHPNAKILVLFGESHLAPQHLPELLQPTLPGERVLTLLQNVDALYWPAMEEHATAVAVGQQAVCVFNSSPAEKAESYRLCLERWNGEAEDSVPDFAPAVYNLIFSLARSLGFKLDSPRNGTQPKFLMDALPEVVAVSTPAEMTSPGPESERAKNQLDQCGCAYVADTNTFFVREFQMPHAAAEAARFLHLACCGAGQPPQAAGARIEATLAHFASRLLAPENNASENEGGEELYRDYIEGRISSGAVRRMFMGRNSGGNAGRDVKL